MSDDFEGVVIQDHELLGEESILEGKDQRQYQVSCFSQVGEVYEIQKECLLEILKRNNSLDLFRSNLSQIYDFRRQQLD